MKCHHTTVLSCRKTHCHSHMARQRGQTGRRRCVYRRHTQKRRQRQKLVYHHPCWMRRGNIPRPQKQGGRAIVEASNGLQSIHQKPKSGGSGIPSARKKETARTLVRDQPSARSARLVNMSQSWNFNRQIQKKERLRTLFPFRYDRQDTFQSTPNRRHPFYTISHIKKSRRKS